VIPAYAVDLWQRAHVSRWRAGPMRRIITSIVVHATSGHGSAQGVADMWSRAPAAGESNSSAHLVVGADAYAIQCVHFDDVANHAHLANAHSIGLEFCARKPGTFEPDDPGVIPTVAQLAKGASIIAWLCRTYAIPATRTCILGHAEADPDTSHTSCPQGDGIDLDHLVADVARLMETP